MEQKTVSTPPPPTIQVDWKALLSLLWSILPTGLLKTALGFILGGWIAGQVVSNQIDSTIKGVAPKGLIEKFLGPKKKPADAITLLRGQGWMCSGTIIGPVEQDDKYVDILTAAHCVKVGQTCRVILKDGRTLAAKCVSRDAGPDVAWLRAERPDGSIPYLLMCDVPPPPGSAVWHQGYGIDKPDNKEEGTVTAIATSRQQVQYRLSVSPGDSGGGIILTADGKVISPVCCTTRLGGMGDVWGGTPAAAAAIRPKRDATFEEPPEVNPILEFPGKMLKDEVRLGALSRR